MEPYLGTKLVIIISFAFWLIASTSVYFFYLVVLHFGYNFTDNAYSLWQLRYLGLGITSISLLLSFLAALLLSRWLGDPLAKLQEAIEKVKAGEFNTFVEIHRQDQLGLLIETFNSMVAAVREKTQEAVAELERLQPRENFKDEVLVNNAYEIGILLNSITEIAQSLIGGTYGRLSEAQKNNIAVIDKSSRRLLKLSSDIFEHYQLKNKYFGGNQLGANLIDYNEQIDKEDKKKKEDKVLCMSGNLCQSMHLENLGLLPSRAQTKIVTTEPVSTTSTGKFTILIVDDDKTSLQILTKLLTPQNYEVIQASSGLQALEKLETGLEPDLIILDIMMPRMDGYEVCQKIRESFPANQLPIIMLTAKDKPSDLVEGLRCGANDYLVKPINRSELLARVKTHIQLAKVNTAYSRFVPNEFIQLLGHESILDVRLGDHVKKEMAILFSDIRSFTTLSEHMSPEENFAFINSYLKMVVPSIRKHNGFIDKYIGDAVMAVFHEQAEDALRAAIEMQKQVLHYNCDRVANGEVPIAVGTGIHVGSLMLGTVGEEQRMEETVISDAVNVASRLEGLTKIFGSTVIFSEKILIELEDATQYRYRFLGKVPVKGRKDAISVFEAFDGEDPEIIEVKIKTRVDFELGISFYYDRKFAEGSEMFETVLKKNPTDKAALLYLERCQKFRK